MWWLTPPERPRALQLPRLLWEQALSMARRTDLRMDWKSRGVFAAESRDYPRWYPGPFKGVVLDVGAGCGETASYFLSHGASEVVCVEPDLVKVGFLRANAAERAWDVKVFARRFELALLKDPCDYLKFDAEGAERALLDWDGPLPPCAIETHEILAGRGITRALISRFRLRVYARTGPTTWVVGTP